MTAQICLDLCEDICLKECGDGEDPLVGTCDSCAPDNTILYIILAVVLGIVILIVFVVSLYRKYANQICSRQMVYKSTPRNRIPVTGAVSVTHQRSYYRSNIPIASEINFNSETPVARNLDSEVSL